MAASAVLRYSGHAMEKARWPLRHESPATPLGAALRFDRIPWGDRLRRSSKGEGWPGATVGAVGLRYLPPLASKSKLVMLSETRQTRSPKGTREYS